MAGGVLITRPLKDAQEMAQSLRDKGYDVFCEPFIDVILHDHDISISDDKYAGLIFTSVNGVRVYVQNTSARNITVYTVGDRTKAEAIAAGFSDITSAAGTVDDLAALLSAQKSPRPYLYIRGQEVAKPLNKMVDGAEVEEVILYHVDKKGEISSECRDAVAQGGVDYVLFFSTRTAQSFVDYIRKEGLEEGLKTSKALCLGASMIEYVSELPWQEVRLAARPDREGILALLED
ncbi:MAG TPA: uroporphyrinogen-III synthase [Alphaproteobacteria bacterium]|nr:uroporphyrinogen-III synthase [Alphaproteobacteria bacterium]